MLKEDIPVVQRPRRLAIKEEVNEQVSEWLVKALSNLVIQNMQARWFLPKRKMVRLVCVSTSEGK